MALDPKLIKESFALVEAQGSIVIEHFYAHLFAHHPDLRWMFPASMSGQRDRLFRALAVVAQQIDNLDALTPILAQLGRDHRKFDVLPEHYDAVGSSLLATLELFAGEAWTSDVAAAWQAAYDLAAKTMRTAAVELEAGAPRYWQANVVAHRRPTWDIAVLTLEPLPALSYTPGQYLTVETPQWPRLWRSYSIANAPRADGTIDLHVRQVDGGQVSWALVDAVRPGDALKLGPPVGSMVPTASPCDLVLIAGGTGLAPLKAIIEHLARQSAQRAVHLFVGARHPGDLYDLSALRELSQRNRWLSVTPVISGDLTYSGLRGPVGEVAAGHQSWIGYEAYVCGPPAMVAATRRALAEVGVADIRIHHEAIQLDQEGEARRAPLAPSGQPVAAASREPLPSRAAAHEAAHASEAWTVVLPSQRPAQHVGHEWNGAPEEDPRVKLARIRELIDQRRKMRIVHSTQARASRRTMI